MSATAYSNYSPVSREVVGRNRPITLDLAKRIIGNLLYAYVRITGNTGLSGLDANGVESHGHTDGEDGMPMPRSLGGMAQGVTIQSSTQTRWLPGVWDKSLDSTALTEGTWYPIDYLYTGNYAPPADLLVEPTFRKVLISPGCNYVGLVITYNTLIPDLAPAQNTLVLGSEIGRIRLRSQPSSDIPGDIDGSNVSSVMTGGNVQMAGDCAICATTSFRGREIRSTSKVLGNLPYRARVQIPQADSVVNDIGVEISEGLSGFAGLVAVSPGELNDINLEIDTRGINAIFVLNQYCMFEVGEKLKSD